MSRKGVFNSISLDENWLFYDNTIKKRHWLDPGEFAKIMRKSDICGGKVIVSCNIKGLVYCELLDIGQTVKADM